LASTSRLLIELAGTAKGTGYDSLAIGGTAALDGLIQIALLDGFQNSIAPGDKFVVLTAGVAPTGAFTNVVAGRVATWDGLGSFRVEYNPAGFLNSVVLSDFQPVPEPSTWALLLAGTGALVGAARRNNRVDKASRRRRGG
jgi:hypothetical protein